MGHEIPVVPMPEAEVEVLARVLLADRQSSLELDPESLNPVLVVGQKVGSHPVIVQLYAIEAVVSEPGRNLLEVVDFLLLTVQLPVVDASEMNSLNHPPSFSRYLLGSSVSPQSGD